ncbi:MAG TPA: SGNH/GDSL hydrolase family protein [Chloroflexota bacterium]|nr:SGNH/GDSL hydrolase family protein [Chloroflexota bacterium]
MKRLVRILAGTVAGITGALLFGELVLRLIDLGHPYYSAPEAYVPKPAPNWLFALKPGFQGRSEGTWISVNSQGLRDGEYGAQPAPGTLRVLTLGDSVTFGPGVALEQTFSKVLERRLSAADASRTYEVLNAGVVGYNTVQELTLFREVGTQYHPNLVVLTFLVNDLLDTFTIFDHQYEPEGRLAALKLWLRQESYLYRLVQNTYWQLANDARRTGPPVEATRPRARLEERQSEIVRLRDDVRGSGAELFLALYPDNLEDAVSPGPDGESRTMRQEMLSFAERAGIPVLDLTAVIGDVRDPRAREMRLREDPHPSVAGHAAIGNALASALQSDGVLEAALPSAEHR